MKLRLIGCVSAILAATLIKIHWYSVDSYMPCAISKLQNKSKFSLAFLCVPCESISPGSETVKENKRN